MHNKNYFQFQFSIFLIYQNIKFITILSTYCIHNVFKYYDKEKEKCLNFGTLIKKLKWYH